MPLKTKEGLIREKSTVELNQVIALNQNNYDKTEKLFAEEELFRWQLKSMHPIEQTDEILLLSDKVLQYIVEQQKTNYSTALYSVANAEYIRRGFAIQEWYYLLEGKKTGPIAKTELEQLVDTNQLHKNDHVFKDGMQDWITVGDAIQSKQIIAVISVNNNIAVNENASEDTLSDVGAIFSFLFPIVGLIIYLNNENNLKGKKAGNIALVGFISGLFFYLLMFTSFFK